jgi:hypothetical protein
VGDIGVTVLVEPSSAGLLRMGQEPDEASSRQAAAGSSRHAVKREGQGAAAAVAGVKRERGEGDAVPRSATADTVDLTEQVRLAAFPSPRHGAWQVM